MKTCPQCGQSNDDTAQTCACGYDLQAAPPVPPVAPLQPPAARPKAKGGELLGWGVVILILGIVALVLPAFGYELLLFRFIPTGNPIFGGAIVAVGVVLTVVGVLRRRA